MMNREQYLLTKLGEEATEIAQIALKTQQFGKGEKYHKHDLNNEERINVEFNDLLAIVDLLNQEFGYDLKPIPSFKIAKQAKIEQYYEYSKDLGMVE